MLLLCPCFRMWTSGLTGLFEPSVLVHIRIMSIMHFFFLTMERAYSIGLEVKLRSPLRGLFKCPADFSSVILAFESASHCRVILELSQGSEKEKRKSRKSVFFFFFWICGHWQTCFHFIVWSLNWAASGDCRQSSALGEGADGGTSTALPEWRQPQRKAKSCQCNGKG